MPIYKDKEVKVKMRHVYCNSCQSPLELRTVTIYKSPYYDKEDPGISFEYYCPHCRESTFLDQEYPRILTKNELGGKILDKKKKP